MCIQSEVRRATKACHHLAHLGQVVDHSFEMRSLRIRVVAGFGLFDRDQ
jgi:hypothetical protein